MFRKAGDIFVGSGRYGQVYESPIPGRVVKVGEDIRGMEDEAAMQREVAEMGLAPKVTDAGLNDDYMPTIEMNDLRANYEKHGQRARGFPEGIDAVRVNQQLGQMALNNIYLKDRHNNNVLYNKMTGRPKHIDFGIANRVTGADQVQALTAVTSDGFEAAGIPEMGDMLRGIVYDYLEGGQVTEAMDVAKQGFSRLQKIKNIAPQ
tara:strand:- start:2950 stop:3564 length:615 start_codon:yes stop_codon:yes gene_type:complete